MVSQAKNNKDAARLQEVLSQLKQYDKQNLFLSVFKDDGKYRRSEYAKHMDFFASGKKFRQRAFIAANRVGKTFSGCYELVCHLTGRYPSWWEGRKFNYPITAWCASITPIQMKDAVQTVLFGEREKGTGMIPKQDYVDENGDFLTWNMPGVPNVVGSVKIKHYDEFGNHDGWSMCQFKTYKQGYEVFQGAKVDVIMLDEEPQDYKIYTECITRTGGDTDSDNENISRAPGILYCTFTPLMGYSDTVLSFLPDGMLPPGGVNPDAPYKKVVNAGWDDVPHLSKEWKEEMLAGYPLHERDARTKGIPTKGSGAIYPYPEEMITIEPMPIPGWWPKAFAMDIGYDHPTTVLWGAIDPETDVLYVYSEHSLRETPVAMHAAAIKTRGDWIPGVIDPSATKKKDEFATVYEQYSAHGIELIPANNAVEPGIAEVQQRIATGRLKVFRTCLHFFAEYRIYRRDENGKIVKKKDDLMDCLRYLCMSGIKVAIPKPDPMAEYKTDYYVQNDHDLLTGY